MKILIVYILLIVFAVLYFNKNKDYEVLEQKHQLALGEYQVLTEVATEINKVCERRIYYTNREARGYVAGGDITIPLEKTQGKLVDEVFRGIRAMTGEGAR